MRCLSNCSERSEVVFRGPFLTLLFPVDRFGELGPQSRGFFSENGFTRQQLLERVHTFYQVRQSCGCVPRTGADRTISVKRSAAWA
jgi:hypothetical protein